MNKSQQKAVDHAIDALKHLQTVNDTEGAHASADEILVNLLTELGLDAVRREYDLIDKWYA